MPTYTIAIPKSDNALVVVYVPDDGGYLDEVRLEDGAGFDPQGYYVAVPKRGHKLEVDVVPLNEYLLKEAHEHYEADRIEQAQNARSDFEEHNIWNKAQTGVK